jgi:hypothetical protein
MNEEIILLGRQLSTEELDVVFGGATTPSSDGCSDDDGNDVPC